jgi:hypothetical protein
LPNFRDIFINRLLQHNVVPLREDAEILCDNMYETGAYAAGSFILDCLYDTNFHNDIDIYDQMGVCKENSIPDMMSPNWHKDNICVSNSTDKNYFSNYFSKFGDPNMLFTQALYKLGFKSAHITNTGPDPVLRSFIHKSNESDIKGIYFVNQNPDNKHLIQIIPIDMKLRENERSAIPRFINASFDLDICQNIFDGKNLQIKNINKLIYKYDYIKPNTRFMLTIYEHSSINDDKITKCRMQKYIERGFNIKLHPQYDEIDKFIVDTLKLKKYNLRGHQDCVIINGYKECYNHQQNNFRYIDNGEIDLSKYDIL